jgi:ASC-1-like (ASCH) protein
MIHVAVLMKPYLERVLRGEKTVECRLTRQARAPFESIEHGERIYFKQSSGPYRAVATAAHVMFEYNLTPQRVQQLRADYDDAILGDDAFWDAKADSRFATLIWLEHVQPVSEGPAIRPLQGLAWVSLEEEPAWRREHGGGDSFIIEITPGNLRHGTLYVTHVLDRFPDSARGGATKHEAADPVTLMLHDGPTVQTDIVQTRKLLRTRIWRSWFDEHGARPGDRVVFTPVDEKTYFVGLSRCD